MKTLKFPRRGANLPIKAQANTGVFAFLFNLIDLLTSIITLFGLFDGLFMPNNTQ